MSLNVVPFPIANMNDIPAMARRFADAVEAGEYGEVSAVFLIVEAPDGVSSFGWGETDDPFRNIGLIEAARRMQLDFALPGGVVDG